MTASTIPPLSVMSGEGGGGGGGGGGGFHLLMGGVIVCHESARQAGTEEARIC